MASDLGARVSRSEADAARFKAQAEASAAKGERAGDLVESLEAQIDALQRQLEEEKNGVGVKLMDEATRAAQLADQLQLTQRTANKLAVEVEGYRKDADDFNAKRALAHLQLKAAQEKIETLTEQRDEAESKADERVKAKANEVTAMRRAKERAEARAAELEAKSERDGGQARTRSGGIARGGQARGDGDARPQLRSQRHARGAALRRGGPARRPDAAVADDDVELDVFLPSGSAQAGGARLGTGTISVSLLPRRWKIRTRRRPGRSRARRARGFGHPRGVAAGVRHGARAALLVQQRHDGDRVGVAGGARVRGGAADSGEDDDLPRHFEGPSGLNLAINGGRASREGGGQRGR